MAWHLHVLGCQVLPNKPWLRLAIIQLMKHRTWRRYSNNLIKPTEGLWSFTQTKMRHEWGHAACSVGKLTTMNDLCTNIGHRRQKTQGPSLQSVTLKVSCYTLTTFVISQCKRLADSKVRRHSMHAQ